MATGSNSERILIRRAKREDLPQLTNLLERYYTEWNVVQRDTSAATEEYVQQAAPFGFVVAEIGGVLAGCVLLRALPSAGSAGECKRLYVLSEHRGRGLASLLMDCLEAIASETVDWIYLDTGPNFTAAQRLYLARGYKACERYNDNPQATWFFRKRLRS